MTTTSFVVTRREFRSETFCCYCRTSFRFSLKLLTLIILLMKGALCGPLFPLFSRCFSFLLVLNFCVCVFAMNRAPQGSALSTYTTNVYGTRSFLSERSLN